MIIYLKFRNILVDAGYSGEKFANSVSEILGCSVEVVKGNEMRGFEGYSFLKDMGCR